MNNEIAVNLNLENKKCLIIGYGKVGQRKYQKLKAAKAIVEVYDIKNRSEQEVTFIKDLTYITDYFLVVLATDDRNFNQKIINQLKTTNVLINDATSKENSGITFLDEFHLSGTKITISCKDHQKRTKLKAQIKELIGNE